MRNRTTVASKGRDIQPTSDYSYYNMHQTSGLVLTDRAPAIQQLIGDISLAGTASWLDGAFRPQGDHAQRDTSSGTIAALDMSTLTNQWLCFGELKTDTDRSATFATTEAILYSGSNIAGQGQIKLAILGGGAPNGRIQYQVNSGSTGSTTGTVNSVSSMIDGSRHTFMAYIDSVNNIAGIYVDGALLPAPFTVPAADMPAAPTTRGMQLFVQNTNDGGTAWAQQLGVLLTDINVMELFMVRTLSDESVNLGAYALAWHNKPSRELPSNFHGI